ncbi:carboxymuconolactone decarboxylase family protein [Chitinophaga niabensis]|uniref:Alkylhydroperoxidase AhpD family core domain-containing protein n=1 Tax=Chitinophaga niabensis TaxID=536979 RepID=A0A1N6F894_9BACT|nr:carboxymuconolactone decarboxylase family protein [Chitinophaga niabensis]SIN91469.1 alkylhydroperoxidase AhpD family core domain-containing protein [Chitinophaga niabensis]
MEARINIAEKGREALKTLFNIGAYLSKSPIEVNLRELINLRVSQINSCAYCIDMHYKNAKAKGETEKRLYGLSTWRQTNWYSDREKAAFAFAEAVTAAAMTDLVYKNAGQFFSEEELVDLTLIITTINTWNRFNNTFSTAPE